MRLGLAEPGLRPKLLLRLPLCAPVGVLPWEGGCGEAGASALLRSSAKVGALKPGLLAEPAPAQRHHKQY